MNNEKEFELLSDIAKLLNKYGSDTFGLLADRLSNPQLRDQLIQILSATKRLSPNKKSLAKRPTASELKEDFRSKLAAFEPDKGKLLLRLYEGLETKEILPSLREIQMFALDNGMPSIKATSRDKAINALLKIFFSMPVYEIEKYLRNIHSPITPTDRSLEGWSNIIFGDTKGLH